MTGQGSDEETIASQRFRSTEGIIWIYERFLTYAIPLTGVFFILNIPLYFGVSLFTQQYLGFFLGLILALMFLIIPAFPKLPKDKVPLYDILFSLLSFAIGIYILTTYPKLIVMIGVINPYKVMLGSVALVLVVEGTRRVAGWSLVAVVLLFILYFRFGYILPGVLSTPGASWGRLVTQLFLGADSLYGVALRIASMIVFAFVLFAQVLFNTGGGIFLFRLAESVMGRYRGGPAKVSILASSFFGMLSGSAVANVVGTGLITIPLMKKTGYKAHYASAIEAVASTGGVITPPIMGAAAFIIAEFLGLSYANVVYVAIVPAVLYYLCLFIQVDLRALKDGLKGLPEEEIPSIKEVILDGWVYLIPIIVLVYSIFFLYLRPETAALYALLSLLFIAFMRKETRLKLLSSYISIFEGASRGMFETAIVCGAAGIVIGVITYSGLGLTLSRVLTAIAGENLILLAIMTAIASIILGMGMPVTAAYLLLALLIAPALINLGVQPLIAHLFIFYFGAFSFITPPVCLATYAAASIGGASFSKTAMQAIKLSLVGFIVPFIFLFNPAVALMGTWAEIVSELIFAIFAVISMAIALEGFFTKRMLLYERIILALVSVALFLPLQWFFSLGAIVVFVAWLMLNVSSELRIKKILAIRK